MHEPFWHYCVMKLFVVLNCAAGALLVGDQAELSRMISETFQARDVEADIVCARGGDIADMVRFARDRAEFDGVVIGGGDGTISAATDVLIGSDKALGILPLGTLNHFARDLGIPPTMEAAIAVIAAGHVRSVDVGTVNGETFVNNSSVGVYPYMVVDRDRRRSAIGLGKWPAMVLAAIRTLRRFPFRRLTMHAAGLAKPYRTPILFVGNNEYNLSLLSLGRRRQLDLGRLQIYVVHAQTRLGLIFLAIKALFGFGRSARDLDMLEAPSFTVQSRTSRLPVALDGEVKIMQPPLHYEIRPSALKVFAPAAPETATM
jgi:diacylglycerol kinase family enzyme